MNVPNQPGLEELERLREENRRLQAELARAADARGAAERLRAYIRAVPDISLILDEDGRYVEVLGEPGLLAVPASTVIGRRIHDIFPAAVADEFMAVITAAIETGAVQTKEYPLEVQSGARWFEGRVARLETSIEGKRAALWVSWDITARKQAEQALLRQTEMLEKLVEQLPVMLVWVDPSGVLSAMNRATEQTLGWTWAETKAHPDIMAAYYPDAATRADAIAFMRSREPGWRPFRVCTKDGRVLETMWANVHLSDGRAVGIGQDLTEQKRLEHQVWQSQKLESIGRLAGGVAHDFNNLLTAILGYGELLDAQLTTTAAHDDLREITRAAERARELTKQLLAFARRQVIAPRVIDLSAVVAGMERLIRRLVGENVELVLKLAPKPWPVLADAAQIEQVVMNLAINARDAMPGGGRLTIEVVNLRGATSTTEPEPPGTVVMRVRDTGHGMAPELIEHVFEPFYTTKAPGEGTGLGLATVYGIVTQTGGHITVDSTVGAGTTFEIQLPRTTLSPEAPEVTGPLPRPQRSGTILVVEDEEQVRRLLLNGLQNAGYQVLTASNAQDALRVADGHKGPIHLLVTDVVMPGMSGRQLADQLQARRPETPCLFVSGYSAEMVEHGLGPGRAFLAKPFTTRRLVAKIEEILAT